MDPRRIRDALAGVVPSSVLEPAFAWTVGTGYLMKFGLGALRRNRALQNRNRGERCFVLGTGPSLRSHDLAKLEGEHVFTVNSFVQHAAELGVTPTCHTVIDPFYFDVKNDAEGTLRRTAALAPGTLRIFPLHYKAVVEPLVPDATYIVFAGDFAGNRNADLAKPIPSLYSVTNMALLAAVYLGFSQIYLLGCEMDMMSRIEAVQPLRIRESHYYADEVEVADWGKLGYDYTRYAHMILRMFEGFRFVQSACTSGQTIWNATPAGCLDVFPRVEFTSLF